MISSEAARFRAGPPRRAAACMRRLNRTCAGESLRPSASAVFCTWPSLDRASCPRQAWTAALRPAHLHITARSGPDDLDLVRGFYGLLDQGDFLLVACLPETDPV